MLRHTQLAGEEVAVARARPGPVCSSRARYRVGAAVVQPVAPAPGQTGAPAAACKGQAEGVAGTRPQRELRHEEAHVESALCAATTRLDRVRRHRNVVSNLCHRARLTPESMDVRRPDVPVGVSLRVQYSSSTPCRVHRTPQSRPTRSCSHGEKPWSRRQPCIRSLRDSRSDRASWPAKRMITRVHNASLGASGIARLPGSHVSAGQTAAPSRRAQA